MTTPDSEHLAASADELTAAIYHIICSGDVFLTKCVIPPLNDARAKVLARVIADVIDLGAPHVPPRLVRRD